MAWLTLLRSGLGTLRIHPCHVLDEQPEHGEFAPCIAVLIDGVGNRIVAAGALVGLPDHRRCHRRWTLANVAGEGQMTKDKLSRLDKRVYSTVLVETIRARPPLPGRLAKRSI